jgi:membrane protein EpsK
MFYGAESAGEYAIALQWVILLRSIAHVISGILTPTILSYYALKKSEEMIQVSKYAVKIMGMVMAIPIGLICGFSSQILFFWVGEKFIFLGSLLTIMTIHLAINLSVLPLFSINVAYNKVQVPGIVTFFMGIGNFALAALFSSLNFFGYFGVAIAGAIVLTIKNALFTPWYATRVLSIRANTFTRAIYPGLIGSFFFILSAYSLNSIFFLNSIISLGTVMFILSFCYLLLLWKFGFSTQEINFIVRFIKHLLRRVN